jgi:hypothetical protein
MSGSIAQLLQEYPYLKLLPNNRINCNVTGHELPLKIEAISAHLAGKKFKKQLEWYNYDYSEFLPLIVSHKHDSKKLYCTITKRALNKIPEEIRKHINGKRFQRYVLVALRALFSYR